MKDEAKRLFDSCKMTVIDVPHNGMTTGQDRMGSSIICDELNIEVRVNCFRSLVGNRDCAAVGMKSIIEMYLQLS